MSVQRCMIVPDKWVALARALTDSTGPAAEGMFRVPLSPTGSMPATHWISAGMIDEMFASVLPLTRYEGDEAVTEMPPPEALAGLCKHLGITPPDNKVLAAMLADVHVTDSNDPFSDMARVGVVMASEDVT